MRIVTVETMKAVLLHEFTEAGEEEDELVSQHQQPGDKPPAAVLIEVDEDGRETIISDHSTSAAFTLQNSLIYELD